jgi:DNA polymerase III epsilon subunit family exonuclease
MYVAFDLETTGLFAHADRIVEIGAVRFDEEGREHGRFESLVNPGRPMPPGAQAVHGLGDSDLAGAPSAREVLPRFLAWLGEPSRNRLIAHNAVFDAGFLGHELVQAGYELPAIEILDSLALSRARVPDAPDYRLGTLAAWFGLEAEGSHRALSDSLVVKGLWLALASLPGPPVPHVSYRVFDPVAADPAPVGWEALAEAMARGLRVRMEYLGGTRGDRPREITPRRFAHRGGLPYVVAYCHADDYEKAFRLDRVRAYEILA